MACSSDTSAGTLRIWFWDRSSRSSCLSVPSPEGNLEKWFLDRLRVRRDLSWPRVGGSCWIWFPFRLRVSSFFSFPISSGRTAVDRRTASQKNRRQNVPVRGRDSLSRLEFSVRLLSCRKFPMKAGRTSILFPDRSTVLRLAVSL